MHNSTDNYHLRGLDNQLSTITVDNPQRFSVSHQIRKAVEYLYTQEGMSQDGRDAYVMKVTKSFTTALKNETDPVHKCKWMSELGNIIDQLNTHGGVSRDCYTACVEKTMAVSMNEIKNLPDDLKTEALISVNNCLTSAFPHPDLYSFSGDINREACPGILKTYIDTVEMICDQDSDQNPEQKIKQQIIKTLSDNKVILYAPENILVKFDMLSLDKEDEQLKINLRNIDGFLRNQNDAVKLRYMNDITQKMNPLSILSEDGVRMGTRDYFVMEDAHKKIASTLNS